VAVKIRLKRLGKIRQPYYRIVVADSRTRRDGRVIEEIGKYHPKADPSVIEVVSERAQYWLSVGAQPTEAVEAILKVTGDWQKFRGEPGAEGTLKLAEEKRSKQDIFNEILKEKGDEPKAEAVTKKAAKKAEEAPAAEAPAAAEVPAVETPEGATAEAEAAEPAEVAADVAESKAGGEQATDASGEPVEG
jgi:small subunit ribosomal protein S16